MRERTDDRSTGDPGARHAQLKISRCTSSLELERPSEKRCHRSDNARRYLCGPEQMSIRTDDRISANGDALIDVGCLRIFQRYAGLHPLSIDPLL